MYQNKYNDSDVNYSIIDDDDDSFGNYEDSGRVYDSLFGIGNKKKKAERKLKKAEKKLAKGNTKAAERKMKKAGKILNKIEQGQTKALTMNEQLANINQQQQVLEATDPSQTENMYYAPGQIGSEAGSTTVPQYAAARQSMGGGTGDIPDYGMDFQDDLMSTSDGSSSLSTAQNPKELAGVTVGNKKVSWLTIGIVVVVAIVLVVVLIKFSKKK